MHSSSVSLLHCSLVPRTMLYSIFCRKATRRIHLCKSSAILYATASCLPVHNLHHLKCHPIFQPVHRSLSVMMLFVNHCNIRTMDQTKFFAVRRNIMSSTAMGNRILLPLIISNLHVLSPISCLLHPSTLSDCLLSRINCL